MKRLAKYFFSLIIFLIMAVIGHTQIQKKHFSKSFKHKVDLGYLLYLPDDFGMNADQKYPLLLFLHGSGERGTNPDLVKKHGPLKVADSLNLPFIVLGPQCPDVPWWEVNDVKMLLDEIIETLPVDTSRIYITGLSMGGFATWDMLMKYPDVFAAAIPVCGGGYPFRAHLVDHVPIWAFHGAQDDVVPVEYSSRMVKALKENGADVKFTVYPDANHDAWTETYNKPEIYRWLLQHAIVKK